MIAFLILGLFLVLGSFPNPQDGSQSQPTTSDTKTQTRPAKRLNPETLRKYVGRYELEVGIIPISTLDVTLEREELWIKTAVVNKHRLLHKSKTVFIDEIAGTPCTFNKDDDGKIISLTFEYENAIYTAQKILLPPPSLKGNTTFRLKGFANANFVILSGTFNNWNQSQLVFGREGDEWICRIDLGPGKYAYKYIVDGNWMLDPANPVSEEDEAGNVNSVLVVSPH